jgi:hypothetical protein
VTQKEFSLSKSFRTSPRDHDEEKKKELSAEEKISQPRHASTHARATINSEVKRVAGTLTQAIVQHSFCLLFQCT